MIKKIMFLAMACSFLIMGSASFAETLTIENSLQTLGISGSITDGEINWGQVGVNQSVNTSAISDSQSVNNLSVGYAVNIAMQVLDFTGSDTNTLVASWDGSPDLDEFEMSIPAMSTTLKSSQWSPILYTILENDSQVVDFELLMGTGVSVVDTYSGIIRIAITEAL